MDFDKVYKHYDNFMKLFRLYKVEQMEEVLNLQGNEIVLDIGGGTGYLASHISKKCKKVYVLDESEKMLSRIKVSDNVIPIVGDALDLNTSIEDIDLVIMSDVFHHIKEQEKLIQGIYKKLNKNGKILILEFNKEHYKTKILRIFEYLLFGKLYFRSRKEVTKIIQRKFNIKKFVDYKYYFIILGERK